jgi:CBS domain containing-hemolysin-like protein
MMASTSGFLVILLGILTLLAVSLQRTYSRIPLKELKRRARGGDEVAAGLVKVVGYGHSLRAALWFLIGITAAGFFVAISRQAPTWFALTASGLLIWLGFVWLPAARVTNISEHLAAWFAPVIAKLLSYLHPIIDWAVRFIRRHKPVHFHTGLYDRSDLIDLLERQQVQSDNRIEKQEIDIATHALSFGDITIGERMTPRRVVKQVSVDDQLGPILMDELHASGHSRFPVYETKKDNIVGTLFLHDLVRAKESGTVRKLMRSQVYYLHEEQSLHDALQAILKTHHHLFIVVNGFEEYVGIISSEDVMEAILGKPIIDEFDQYDDLRAVAARDAKTEHQDHLTDEPLQENKQHLEEMDAKKNEGSKSS